MKYDKDISIIVPYKPDSRYNDKIWPWIKRKYRFLMRNAEICIGQDDSEPYCKSRSVNKAVSHATRDVFIIVDPDIVFDPVQIEKAMEKLSHYAWVFPFRDKIELSENDTAELLKKCPCGNIADINFSDYKITQPNTGSMCIVHRNSFNMVKGFDERFTNCGKENSAFEISLDTMCGRRYQPAEGTIWQLYYPQPANNIYQSLTGPANPSLYERYLAANGNFSLMRSLIDEKQYIYTKKSG